MNLIKKIGQTLYKSINEAFDFDNIDNTDNLNNSIFNSIELLENKDAIKQLFLQLYQIKLPARIKPIFQHKELGWIYASDPDIYNSSKQGQFSQLFFNKCRTYAKEISFNNQGFTKQLEATIQKIKKYLNIDYINKDRSTEPIVYISSNNLIYIFRCNYNDYARGGIIMNGLPYLPYRYNDFICLNPDLVNSSLFNIQLDSDKANQNLNILNLKSNTKKILSHFNKIIMPEYLQYDIGTYSTIKDNYTEFQESNNGIKYLKITPQPIFNSNRNPFKRNTITYWSALNFKLSLRNHSFVTHAKVLYSDDTIVNAMEYTDVNELFKIKVCIYDKQGTSQDQKACIDILKKFEAEDGININEVKTTVLERDVKSGYPYAKTPKYDVYAYIILSEKGNKYFTI